MLGFQAQVLPSLDQVRGALLYTDSPKNSLLLLCHYGTMCSTYTNRHVLEAIVAPQLHSGCAARLATRSSVP